RGRNRCAVRGEGIREDFATLFVAEERLDDEAHRLICRQAGDVGFGQACDHAHSGFELDHTEAEWNLAAIAWRPVEHGGVKREPRRRAEIGGLALLATAVWTREARGELRPVAARAAAAEQARLALQGEEPFADRDPLGHRLKPQVPCPKPKLQYPADI